MIGALDDDQRVARQVLGRDEPGRLSVSAQAADTEPATLSQRVAFETAVPPDDDPILRLDRARVARQPGADERAERAFADEADPRRVALVGDRQSAAAGEGPDLALLQAADREIAVRQLRRVERVQEVTLVLAGIQSAQQARPPPDARVMPGGEPVGAEPARIGQPRSELDLAIAEHVRVGRAARLQFRQELREHMLAVLRCKADLVQWNAEFGAHTARVLEIRGAGAVTVLVFLPVRHEQGLDVAARLEQQQRGDRGIHAARQRHDRARLRRHSGARNGSEPSSGTWFSSESG